MNEIAKRIRPIPIYEFTKIILENVSNKLLINKIIKKEYSDNKLNIRITEFLLYNKLPIDKDVREININLDSLNNDYLNKFYNDSFEEKDNVDIEDFKTSFILEFRLLLSNINDFEKTSGYELGIKKLEIAIMLRLFDELQRQVFQIIITSSNLKTYLNSLKLARALRIPKSLEDYYNLAKQYHIINSIEKAIERINLRYIDENKITKFYVYPPNHNDILSNLKLITNMDIPCTKMEENLRDLAKSYCSFEVIKVFTNNIYMFDLLNAVCKNDLYKDGLKSLLIEWQESMSQKQKLFNEFIKEMIEKLWYKRLDINEHTVGIIGFIIFMIDEGKDPKEIDQQVNNILVKIYEDIAKNKSIENKLKVRKLKEISTIRESYGNIKAVIEFQQIYKELISSKVDVDRHFFENYYQKKPIKYMFLIFFAYKLNDISFFKKLLLKSYNENRVLRNYARDLLYKKIEDNKRHFNANRAELTKSIFRDYFSIISNDKESISYRKEVLQYLINIIIRPSIPPYEAFYSDLTDVFLFEVKKFLDTNLFNKVITGKQLKPFDERKLEISKYFMADQLLPKMLKELTKQRNKDIYLRKIKLRFGNEYKAIEDKYYKMENKVSI